MAKGKDAPLPRCACPPPRQHRACDPRPGRTLGTPVPGFPRRAAASLRVPGALSLRARARAQGARCKYRAARWGALLRYPTALRGQHSRLHCAPISPAAGRTCPALHCGTDRRRASADAISIAERSAPRGVPAVPPKPPCCAHPTPKQLQAPWWSRSQPLLALLALTFPPHIRRSLWPRRHGFGARLALRTPFVHTLRTAHASQGGHHLARMGTSARFRRPAALAGRHLLSK